MKLTKTYKAEYGGASTIYIDFIINSKWDALSVYTPKNKVAMGLQNKSLNAEKEFYKYHLSKGNEIPKDILTKYKL